MKRNKYSAGAVKFALWFMEFRKAVQFLEQGRTFDEIKALSAKKNIFGASTPARAVMIQSTITARIKNLDSSFYPLFLDKCVNQLRKSLMDELNGNDVVNIEF